MQKVRSLIDLSCSTVEAHIGALSISELLRLPLVQRYQLLDYLSALDVLRLDKRGFMEGLDEEKIWEGRCEGTGIDFTHCTDQDPPEHKMPTFQCLRLYGVVTSTAAKNLISTFLSTPCSSPQSLELDRMHLDTGSTFHENEQTLLMKNTFYRFKTLVIDSIDIEDAKSLGMHKYLRIKSSRLQNSCSGKIDSSFASISDWLLTRPNLKIGFLELRDYAYVTNDICIPSTATIENMKLFITVVRDAQGQWKSQLFFTTLTNPSLQELTWHCRYSVKFYSERFLKSSAFTELLSSSIINHPPGQSLTKLTITINNVFDYKQVHNIVMAAIPNLQFQCYTAAEEQRPQNN
ncbi:hypothetical protein EMCRGX_G001980 [Ephydatia muelleri]